MKIGVVTPAARGSRSGNRVTAVRWARLLRRLGHEVWVDETLQGGRIDVLVAIHAYRSAESVRMWREMHPDRPLAVLLAGTDIYRFQKSHPQATLASMESADRLVGLHDRVAADIPTRFHDKLRIIHQSAAPLPRTQSRSKRTLDVCVVGHLRNEKDPLCAALAARELPAESKIRIVHFGKAHDAKWAAAAVTEMETNPRYVWRGEVPHGRVRVTFARCHAMVISSVMEGGANVVSEAVVAGLPVLASEISGNVGLLGVNYPAYFPASDPSALARLLRRAECDPDFLASLRAHLSTQAPLFTAEREARSWQALLEELS